MRARTFGRWVARAVFVAALGLGLAVPAVATAGETGVGEAVASAVEPSAAFVAFDHEWG
jgi:hypothetical protein